MKWDFIIWADKRALEKAGAFLETPQRLGIWPTWPFWNRRDVWRRGRWLVAPVVGVIVSAVVLAGSALRLPAWTLPITGLMSGGLVAVWMGVLERHLRTQIKVRMQQCLAGGSNEEAARLEEERENIDPILGSVKSQEVKADKRRS